MNGGNYSQTSFSSGQIASTMLGRADLTIAREGLSVATNTNVSNTGDIEKRKGTELVERFDGKVFFTHAFNDKLRVISIDKDKIIIKDNIKGKHINLVSLKLDDIKVNLDTVRFTSYDNYVIITDGYNKPRRIVYQDNNFLIEDLEFDTLPTSLQPILVGTVTKVTGEVVEIDKAQYLKADKNRTVVTAKGNFKGTILKVNSNSYNILSQDAKELVVGDKLYYATSPISGLALKGLTTGSIITVTSTGNIDASYDVKDAKSSASIPKPEAKYPTFRSTDVGMYININGGLLKIVKVTNSYTVNARVVVQPSSGVRTENWILQQETWKEGNYPEFVAIYAQTLILAKGTTLWVSALGRYFSFAPSSKAGEAFSLEVSGDKSNTISWIVPTRDLIIGTKNEEITLTTNSSQGGSSGVLTIQTVVKRIISYHGSEKHEPVKIGNEIIFIQKNGKRLRSLQYSINVDGYQALDLSLYATDLLSDGLVSIRGMTTTIPTIVALTSKGDILTCVYDNQLKVVGWTKYITEGRYTSINTTVGFNYDLLYVTTERCNGKFLEWTVPYIDNKSISNMIYTDCTKHYIYKQSIDYKKGKPIVGLSEGIYKFTVGNIKDKFKNVTLEYKDNKLKVKDTDEIVDIPDGKYTINKLFDTITISEDFKGTTTLDLMVDGNRLNDLKLDDKTFPYEFKLPFNAYDVKIGFEYESVITTLPHTMSDGSNVIINDKAKTSLVKLLVDNSIEPIVNGVKKQSHTTGELTDSPIKLFTGVVEYRPANYDKLGKITIRSADPFPLKILSLYYRRS